MKITILDSSTLGEDISLDAITKIGDTDVYENTSQSEIKDRIKDCNVVVLNKMKLGCEELSAAQKLKLICVTATGYDNVDVKYCRENGIAVCNVVGYSTDSVCLLTVSMALSLAVRLPEYDEYTKSGAYTRSGLQNMLSPVYCEMRGKTWGIIGYGAIGKAVGKVAESFGCRVIYASRTHGGVSVDDIMRNSDFISIHVPLTDETRGMIGKRELSLCERKPVLINVSRGAVCDEASLVEAVKDGTLSGLGVDVYTEEPFGADSPYNTLFDCKRVILTPHMAWGAYEARVRCVNEVAENIKTFFGGGKRNRVC